MTRRPSPDSKRAKRSPIEDHPAAEKWWAWTSGGLSPAETRRLEAHRVACATCRGRAAGVRRLASARGLLDLEAPPTAARRRARGLFETMRRTEAPRPKSASPRVFTPRLPGFARLRLVAGVAGGSSWSGASAPAMRRLGAEPLRRCALEGGMWRLEIEWIPRGRGWAIRGRLVDTREVSARAAAPAMRVESADGRERRVRPGPRGVFGPMSLAVPELRVTLEDDGRAFRSPWLPQAPRARR